MKIVLVAEKISGMAWSTQAPALACAMELGQRGVEVLLLCEAIGGEARTAAERAGVRVVSRVDFCFRQRTLLQGFPRFVRGVIAELDDQWVGVSFSTLVAADVWAPLENREPVVDVRLEDAMHDVILLRSMRRRWAEQAAVRGASEPGMVGRFLSFTPERAGLVHGHRGLDEVTVNIGYLAPTRVLRGAERALLRRQTRELLNIDAGERVILTSADGRSSAVLAALVSSVGHLHHQRRAGAPLLLVITHEPTSVQRAAERAGLAELDRAIRITAPTSRPEALLSAADALAVVTASSGSPGASPARLLCDAMSFGIPVLAAHDAPGAALVARAIRSGEGPHPGLLVSDNTPVAWYRAIEQAMHADFRTNFETPPPAARAEGFAGGGRGFSGGAQERGALVPAAASRALADLHGLSLGEFVDRVERACGQVFAATHLKRG